MFQLNTELLFTWLSRFVVMILCMPLHEAAHAFAADRMGDPTARNQGRLTLNPFRHLDLFGSVLLITVGFGWAKPVPVNPAKFQKPKLGMALTAVAGPLSNILMALVLLACYKVYPYFLIAQGVYTAHPLADTFFGEVISVNLALAVFNLLPVPPLDGSKFFGAVLPDRLYFGIMRYERYIMLALIAFVYLGVFSRPMNYMVRGLISLIDTATAPVELLARRLLLG